MPIAPGTRLGPYEILDLLGGGGMGEVYRARDTRLGRIVALKMITDAIGDDPQVRHRFEREARAIGALNHPNICSVHDVGNHDGRDFLVMEYVDGHTLAERLHRGPLKPPELLSVAIEIAEALVAAHREGITHRDLKPSNVMLTRSGVKLVDFGIAKLRQPEPSGAPSGPDDLFTTAVSTAAGTLIGTVPYMAPEQLEGQPVDDRTDIFSFGAVLFEMATGRPAFAGASTAALTAAILSESRPHLPDTAGASRALDRIISGCLARNPEERWQHAADVARALTWARDDLSETQVAGAGSSRRQWMIHAGWATALLATALLLQFGGRTTDQGPPANPQPVIVLMDSPLPGRVYDPRTAASGGTNADDVTDSLRDLPVAIRKENTSAAWHREEQVVNENPDLIVGHLSCLFDARVVDEREGAVLQHVFDQAEIRLMTFLGYVAARNPRTRFIVYSRARFEGDGESKWVAEQEARLPVLRGRLHAFHVPGGQASATFRDPETARLLRTRVVQVLGLQTQ
jgi:serine/threonine protein kinase